VIFELTVPDEVIKDEPELRLYLDALLAMLNRMKVSHHKYGAMSNKYPESAHAVDSLDKRLGMYRETGNTENLLDVANFAVIEHLFPSHPRAFFRAQSAKESPGLVWNDGTAQDAAKGRAR